MIFPGPMHHLSCLAHIKVCPQAYELHCRLQFLLQRSKIQTAARRLRFIRAHVMGLATSYRGVALACHSCRAVGPLAPVRICNKRIEGKYATKFRVPAAKNTRKGCSAVAERCRAEAIEGEKGGRPCIIYRVSGALMLRSYAGLKSKERGH